MKFLFFLFFGKICLYQTCQFLECLVKIACKTVCGKFSMTMSSSFIIIDLFNFFLSQVWEVIVFYIISIFLKFQIYSLFIFIKDMATLIVNLKRSKSITHVPRYGTAINPITW